MLSVSIQVHPAIGTTEGCIRYCTDSSYDLLKIHSVAAELGVSVLSEKEVIHQLCINTPEGLFKPFFASVAKEHLLLSKSDNQFGDADCNNLIYKFSALTATDGHLSNGTEIQTDDIQMSSPKERPEIDSELLSKFSSLTTFERDSKNTKLDERTGEPNNQQFTEFFFDLKLLKHEMLDDVLSYPCTLPTVKEFLTDTIKVGMHFDILCTKCGRILTLSKALDFERVEQCCEGLTSELSDSFFCHAESPTISVVMPRSLYFDTACFYLHCLFMDKLYIQDLGANKYACGDCGSLLTSGSKPVQGYTQFFCDKIQFKLSKSPPVDKIWFKLRDSSPVDLSYSFKMAWVTLWGFIESALETSPVCKLYLHSKGIDKETCLLLQVLPEKVSCFLFQSTTSMQTDFRTEEMYQVSYLTSAPSSKAVRTWRHAFDVDFYKVSDSMMSVMVQHLSKASVFSSTQNTADGFVSSFLPASFPATQAFK